MLAYIGEMDPDILCLQEVTFAPEAGPDLLYYHGADKAAPLPQRANLLADVAAVLPGHQTLFAPAMQGVLFDAEGAPHRSEFGLATFVRRRLPVIGQVQGFVHGAFRSGGWGAPPMPRNAHGVRLHDYSGGAPVAVMQVHGLRDPAGKHDTPARVVQADRLAGMVAQVRQPGDRVILCGDFNLLPDSATFAVLAGLGLRDLVTGRGFTDTRTSHYAKAPRYADYMLVSDAVRVERFDVVVSPEVSDHRALLLDFG